MNTTILIEGLILSCRIGVPRAERSSRQAIHVDLACDLGAMPILRDDLKQTLNYALLHKQLLELAEKQSFVLLETLAEVIARICLADKRVQTVTISLRKPNKLANCAFVGVKRTFHHTELTQ